LRKAAWVRHVNAVAGPDSRYRSGHERGQTAGTTDRFQTHHRADIFDRRGVYRPRTDHRFSGAPPCICSITAIPIKNGWRQGRVRSLILFREIKAGSKDRGQVRGQLCTFIRSTNIVGHSAGFAERGGRRQEGRTRCRQFAAERRKRRWQRSIRAGHPQRQFCARASRFIAINCCCAASRPDRKANCSVHAPGSFTGATTRRQAGQIRIRGRRDCFFWTRSPSCPSTSRQSCFEYCRNAKLPGSATRRVFLSTCGSFARATGIFRRWFATKEFSRGSLLPVQT